MNTRTIHDKKKDTADKARTDSQPNIEKDKKIEPSTSKKCEVSRDEFRRVRDSVNDILTREKTNQKTMDEATKQLKDMKRVLDETRKALGASEAANAKLLKELDFERSKTKVLIQATKSAALMQVELLSTMGATKRKREEEEANDNEGMMRKMNKKMD